MNKNLRDLLQQIVLEQLVRQWHVRTQIPTEYLQDAALEVIAALLTKEEVYRTRFEHIDALKAYIRKSSIRRAVVLYRTECEHANIDDWQPTDPTLDPEQYMLFVLEQQNFITLLEQTLKRAGESEGLLREGKELVEEIMSAPEVYIQRRKSGKEKRKWVFHYVALARALQWNKQKVYDRLERIRSLFLRERTLLDMDP